MSHAFTMFDPQHTHHMLQPMQRALTQADIDAQRAAKRAIAQRANGDEVFRNYVQRLRSNTTWMSDYAKSRRILSAREYGPWRDTFERTMAMHRRMPIDGLNDVIERQCETLKGILGYTDTAELSSITPDIDGGAIARAFKNVHCALRQLESDCTSTSKRQAMRSMLRLQRTVTAQFEVMTGGTIDTPYQFSYPE